MGAAPDAAPPPPSPPRPLSYVAVAAPPPASYPPPPPPAGAYPDPPPLYACAAPLPPHYAAAPPPHVVPAPADSPLPCLCGYQLTLLALGFFFWPLWFVGACLGARGDARERPGWLGNVACAAVFSVAVAVALAVGFRFGIHRGDMSGY